MKFRCQFDLTVISLWEKSIKPQIQICFCKLFQLSGCFALYSKWQCTAENKKNNFIGRRKEQITGEDMIIQSNWGKRYQSRSAALAITHGIWQKEWKEFRVYKESYVKAFFPGPNLFAGWRNMFHIATSLSCNSMISMTTRTYPLQDNIKNQAKTFSVAV